FPLLLRSAAPYSAEYCRSQKRVVSPGPGRHRPSRPTIPRRMTSSMATEKPPQPTTRARPKQSRAEGTMSPEAVIAMHSDPRFLRLKKSLFSFIFPMSLAFLSWYVLYVLMTAFARDLMSVKLLGEFNLALLFGVLQFITTFSIAIFYSNYSRKRLDPDASVVRESLENGVEEDK